MSNLQEYKSEIIPINDRQACFMPVNTVDPSTTFFFPYVHGPLDGQTPKIGKIATLLQLSTNQAPNPKQLEKIEAFGQMCSIQIAGGKPNTLSDKVSYVISFLYTQALCTFFCRSF